MYNLQKLTSLRILVASNEQIGTGRDEGLEVIPYTPYIANKWFNQETFLPPPGQTEVAPEFLTTLRPYQIDDIKTLISRKSSANLSEPRTGKTPTAIRLFKAKGLNKILIVTPASALFQWKHEFLRWFNAPAEVLTPSLTPTKKSDLISRWGTEFPALIISYDSLKLVERNGKQTGLLSNIIKCKDIDGVIVDEAHRIRNRRSLQAKAIFALSKIPNKHVLTGTPAHGKLEDLYSILHFLYPSVFTGYWRFINYYFKTMEMTNRAQATTYIEVLGLKNDRELPEFINRIAVQHKRKDVMQWLPDKDYQEVKLPLTKEQTKYLKDLESDFETEHIIVDSVLTQLIRSRQVCNAPELLELKGISPKIEWLKDYFSENPDVPTIVFTNFTQFIHLIVKHTGVPHVIIGATSSIEREKIRTNFQTGVINQLIINTQAGKEALTIDRAQVAIFLDIYPPYGDIDQAENRFTATTPELKDKPHTIIQVMMENSYDEKLFELVRARASETDIINSYKKHIERRKNEQSEKPTKHTKGL
jgi:SNF2 family DNA or RNA helicase